MNKNRLYIIGVTGKICSGKSAAVKFLSSQPNTMMINLDHLGHLVYQKNFIFLNEIKNLFYQLNNKIFDNKDTFNEILNRKELGKIVFKNKKYLKILNKLIRPEITNLLKIYINKIHSEINNPKILFIEGALIGDPLSNYFPYDEIWLTVTNQEETEKRFLQRLACQNIKEYNKDIFKDIISSQDYKVNYTHLIDTSTDFDITKLIYLKLYNEVIKKIY